ncbi:minichromosome maintenance protein MCM [Candidatus Woesearchaeota archaeon]|nr:minichromosome maintenance protein MCM [Candidatus Woesearchaeota archaeon]
MDAKEQIEKFRELIETTYLTKLHELANIGVSHLIMDFNDVAIFDHELAEELLENPDELLKAAEVSIEDLDLPEKRFIIRIANLPKSQNLKIRNIRSPHLNKLYSFDGIVRQSSDVRPQVTSARFECPSCGNVLSILQIDTKFKEPYRCTCGRKGRFRMLDKILVDAQRLVIEEAPEDLEGGEQPKRISVFLKEDLVEPKMEKKTTPGSKIRVIGVVREIPVPLKTGVVSTRYDLSVDANYIEPIEQTFEEFELTKEEEENIKALAKKDDIYGMFTRSIAPSVYGHDDVKEALVLQLMGGIKKTKPDGTIIRGDFHVLLVGDPGSAKSTLLLFMSKASPKSRYISGKGASAAGLTASVVKDEFLKGWALEAGALVLANGGFCYLDELDKMTEEETSALHEALEQQIVSISKANIQATLKAQTTVLAAANPKLGRFDPYKPVAEQINLPPALINRFDLIFPIRDVPNKELDEKIAGHVLNYQQAVNIKEVEIDIGLIKKYVSYAKQKIYPKLSDGAVEEIKNFYVSLRNSGGSGKEGQKPIPISARQLEALVRLSEASARVRLSDKVTKQDAKRAIRVLKYCLMQVGIDPETGQIDIDRISTGISSTQRSRIVVIKEIITELSNQKGKLIAIEDVITYAAEKGINEAQVEEVLDRLKREAEIFEPKRGSISKL